jgi:MFS family permease
VIGSVYGDSTLVMKVYYGWYVVAALFLVLTVSSGFGFYNLSVYLNVLAAKTGFSISELSVAVSLFFVVGGVAGIWVAHLLDRFDVRWVMIGGAVLAGAALGTTGRVEDLWLIYVLYMLFGIGNAAVSIVTSTTLVTRWFPGPERSIALSIASTGLSLGGVVLTPLSAKLFNDFGVQQVMPWIGLAFAGIIAPVVIVVLRPPNGNRPRGQDGGEDSGWAFRDAVRSRFFILLTGAFVLCMAAQVGGISHLYNRAEGLVDYVTAAVAVQVLTIMSILCRILGGFLVTRISIRLYTLGNLLGQTAGLALIATAETAIDVLIGAGVFGATVGNLLMLQPLWLAEAFGVKAYARIFSLSNAIAVVGVAGGPVVLGLTFDSANYRLSYLVAAGLSLAAWGLMFTAGPTPAAEVGESEPARSSGGPSS